MMKNILNQGGPVRGVSGDPAVRRRRGGGFLPRASVPGTRRAELAHSRDRLTGPRLLGRTRIEACFSCPQRRPPTLPDIPLFFFP